MVVRCFGAAVSALHPQRDAKVTPEQVAARKCHQDIRGMLAEQALQLALQRNARDFSSVNCLFEGLWADYGVAVCEQELGKSQKVGQRNSNAVGHAAAAKNWSLVKSLLVANVALPSNFTVRSETMNLPQLCFTDCLRFYGQYEALELVGRRYQVGFDNTHHTISVELRPQGSTSSDWQRGAGEVRLQLLRFLLGPQRKAMMPALAALVPDVYQRAAFLCARGHFEQAKLALEAHVQQRIDAEAGRYDVSLQQIRQRLIEDLFVANFADDFPPPYPDPGSTLSGRQTPRDTASS